MIRRLYLLFSKPKNLAILNGVLIAIMISINISSQAFCIPTTWAAFVLAICFLNVILFPIFEKTKLAPLMSFINGVALFVFMYCVVFLDQFNFIGLLLALVGIGLVLLIPHFFILQLIEKNLIEPAKKTSRIYFLLAVVLCSLTTFYVGEQYKKGIASIEAFEQSNFEELEKNFMTEKILGMHLIYHTRFCIYDGWRPPKHEPILVLGMWLNNRYDPLNIDLKTRLELYKIFFPENTYKFDCSCALRYRDSYHNDNLWK